MGKNKIIFIGASFVLVMGLIIVIANKEKSLEISSTTETPAGTTSPENTIQTQSTQGAAPEAIYTLDGKLDTSNWVEYKSRYGGFSVRAPQSMASVGCFIHGCEPQRDGEPFRYIIAPDEGGGIAGMTIEVIKKEKDTNLDNWISKYIISGSEEIFAIQKTTINNHKALQFDLRVKNSNDTVYMEYTPYPSGVKNKGNIAGYNSISYRFFVVDLGDRYAVISHTLSIDSKALLDSMSEVGPLTPKVFNNKFLSDVYRAILESFLVLTPEGKS